MSTNYEDCTRVVSLCREVEAMAKEVAAARAKAEKLRARPGNVRDNDYWAEYWRTAPSTKLTAALKRRSMDLTRALADLRRS